MYLSRRANDPSSPTDLNGGVGIQHEWQEEQCQKARNIISLNASLRLSRFQGIT